MAELNDEIYLKVAKLGSTESVIIDNATSYSFESDFLIPSDAFSLQIEGNNANELVNQVQEGDEFQLFINNNLQATGYLDDITYSQSRESGSVLSISGRDRLGLVADAVHNPALQITPNMTYQEVFEKILTEHFGFDLEITDEDNGQFATIASGVPFGRRTKKGRRRSAKSIKDRINHQSKPRKEEGYLTYLDRLAKRVGWFINLSPDGSTVCVSAPSYSREFAPKCFITNNSYPSDKNNVLSWNIKKDINSQPHAIYMVGSGGGSNVRRNISQILMLNDIISFDDNEFPLTNKSGNINTDLVALISSAQTKRAKIVEINKDLRQISKQLRPRIPTLHQYPAKILFLQDYESNDLEEMEFFVRREMNKLQNNYFTLETSVPGHVNYNSPDAPIWTPNMMVTIESDLPNLKGDFWIQKRTFVKNRNGGTKTNLTIKLPYVFEF